MFKRSSTSSTAKTGLSFFDRISKRFAQKDKVFPSGVTMRKVFVLPRRHGFMVGFSCLGVFAIAIRIQNNMLLLLSVALFILFLMSLVWAGRNMAGITVAVQSGQRLIAGKAQEVKLTIRSDRPRHFVVAAIGKTKHRLDLSRQVTSIGMTITIDQRGKMMMPALILESDFPFGLARCWAWISGGTILVAPAPKPSSLRQSDLKSPVGQTQEDEEASGADSLAEWVDGTPQTRIHWKRFAATGRLLVKTGDHSLGDQLHIDYARFQSLGHEAALSAMCAIVLEAESQSSPFLMRLPSGDVHSITGQSGEALDALALA